MAAILFPRIIRFLIVTVLFILGLLTVMVIFCVIALGDTHDIEDFEFDEKGRLIMKKFIAHWYNDEEVVCDDGPFEAPSKDAAVSEAYRRQHGKPPAPLLSLEEVK